MYPREASSDSYGRYPHRHTTEDYPTSAPSRYDDRYSSWQQQAPAGHASSSPYSERRDPSEAVTKDYGHGRPPPIRDNGQRSHLEWPSRSTDRTMPPEVTTRDYYQTRNPPGTYSSRSSEMLSSNSSIIGDNMISNYSNSNIKSVSRKPESSSTDIYRNRREEFGNHSGLPRTDVNDSDMAMRRYQMDRPVPSSDHVIQDKYEAHAQNINSMTSRSGYDGFSQISAGQHLGKPAITEIDPSNLSERLASFLGSGNEILNNLNLDALRPQLQSQNNRQSQGKNYLKSSEWSGDPSLDTHQNDQKRIQTRSWGHPDQVTYPDVRNATYDVEKYRGGVSGKSAASMSSSSFDNRLPAFSTHTEVRPEKPEALFPVLGHNKTERSRGLEIRSPSPVVGLESDQYNTCIYLEMEEAPDDFGAVQKILGADNENLDYVREATGATVELRGEGTRRTPKKPLHLYISHSNSSDMLEAEKLAQSLVSIVQEEFKEWKNSHPAKKRTEHQDVKVAQRHQLHHPAHGTTPFPGDGQTIHNISPSELRPEPRPVSPPEYKPTPIKKDPVMPEPAQQVQKDVMPIGLLKKDDLRLILHQKKKAEELEKLVSKQAMATFASQTKICVEGDKRIIAKLGEDKRLANVHTDKQRSRTSTPQEHRSRSVSRDRARRRSKSVERAGRNRSRSVERSARNRSHSRSPSSRYNRSRNRSRSRERKHSPSSKRVRSPERSSRRSRSKEKHRHRRSRSRSRSKRSRSRSQGKRDRRVRRSKSIEERRGHHSHSKERKRTKDEKKRSPARSPAHQKKSKKEELSKYPDHSHRPPTQNDHRPQRKEIRAEKKNEEVIEKHKPSHVQEKSGHYGAPVPNSRHDGENLSFDITSRDFDEDDIYGQGNDPYELPYHSDKYIPDYNDGYQAQDSEIPGLGNPMDYAKSPTFPFVEKGFVKGGQEKDLDFRSMEKDMDLRNADRDLDLRGQEGDIDLRELYLRPQHFDTREEAISSDGNVLAENKRESHHASERKDDVQQPPVAYLRPMKERKFADRLVPKNYLHLTLKCSFYEEDSFEEMDQYLVPSNGLAGEDLDMCIQKRSWMDIPPLCLSEVAEVPTGDTNVWVFGDMQIYLAAQATEKYVGGQNLGLAGVKIHWIGVPGLVMCKVVSTVEDYLQSLPQPDCLIIHAGTEDIANDTHPDYLKRTITETLLDLRARLPNARIFWSEIPEQMASDPSADVKVAMIRSYANEIAWDVTSNKMREAGVVEHEAYINLTNEEYYRENGIYVNDKGAFLMMRNMKNAVFHHLQTCV